ncbi:MAG: fimbria/pilus periplasmic chaperone [Alphaproteobacteria bacterium]|nr:fimbria/pilus periplasmic chaperone [Alphaproteobacteria bacterium]MDD9919702.1 fimbria/pilus periplasmic chaperone [Alphaproteobacteria bacterium]
MFYLLAIVLSVITVPLLHAQIAVDDVIIHFTPGKRPVATVNVFNTHPTDTFNITTKAEQVLYPGTQKEERTKTRSLLISPQKFTLTAGTSRKLRLVLRHIPKNEEEIYRVSVAPSLPDIRSEEENVNAQTNVRVLTGMGLLILAPPENATPKMVWKREGNLLTLENQGDVNILLRRQEFCPAEAAGKCLSLPGKRLYAKNTWQLKLPEETSSLAATYNIQYLNQTVPFTFPPQATGVFPTP